MSPSSDPAKQMAKTKVYNSLMVNVKDYVMIIIGLILYAIGFCV